MQHNVPMHSKSNSTPIQLVRDVRTVASSWCSRCWFSVTAHFVVRAREGRFSTAMQRLEKTATTSQFPAPFSTKKLFFLKHCSWKQNDLCPLLATQLLHPFTCCEPIVASETPGQTLFSERTSPWEYLRQTNCRSVKVTQ